MFDIDNDDLECEDMLEQTGDALDTLPQGLKPASAMVDVQFTVPSDDDKTNSDAISILFVFTDALVKLCLKVLL